MGNQFVILRDHTGSSARVMTAYGFNCFSFVPITSTGPREVLFADPAFAADDSPDSSGIPVLFPFGGALTGDSFSWDGTTYQVTSGFGYGSTVMHGFVLNRPWRVIRQSGASVTGVFQASVDDPALLDQWPTDFQIEITYTVAGLSLLAEIVVHNPDTRPCPYGFTLHGYYRRDLGGGDPLRTQLSVPADSTWELVDGHPTGTILPVTAENDLRAGPVIGQTTFDTIFTDVAPSSDGLVEMTLHDPLVDRSVRVLADGPFREIVVYTPQNTDTIAIEPYTCTPGMFDLYERGIDSGLRILEPGQSETMTIEIRFDESQVP